MVDVPEVAPRFEGQDLRLMKAARAGRTWLVRWHLRRGLELDDKDANGETALIFAAMAGRLATVRLLLEAGADTAPKDDMGYDALTATGFFGDFRGALRPPYDEVYALLDAHRKPE